MPKFRKIPVVIDAIRYTGNNEAAAAFVGDQFEVNVTETGIQTLEGFMRVQPGDYIIKGVQGEFYPCKPDIFEATYEALEEGDEERPILPRTCTLARVHKLEVLIHALFAVVGDVLPPQYHDDALRLIRQHWEASSMDQRLHWNGVGSIHELADKAFGGAS